MSLFRSFSACSQLAVGYQRRSGSMKDGVEDSEGCPSRCRVDRMHQVVDRADTEAQAHEEQLHLGVK